MLRRFLRSWFLENAALKLVALILSITLFILVGGEKVTERSVRVGVAYIRPQERVLVSDVPDSVEVWLRGSWTRIKRLGATEVPAIVIDLTKRQDGEVTIDESDIRVPAGLEIVSIRPAKIMVQFEYVKQVPIVPELVGTIADGFIVERVTLDPTTISVSGPQRLVDSIADARTHAVSIAGKRASFRVRVPLAPLPSGVNADSEIVGVDIEIAEEVATRTIAAVKVTLQPPSGVNKLPAVGLEVAPATVSLILRGGKNAMKTIAEDKIGAMVELHLGDLTPGTARQAPVIVTGVPTGVAVEVHPREIFLTMHAPGGARQP